MSSSAVTVAPDCESLDSLAERFGSNPALFLDYDGTLAPIRARPEQAILDDDVRGTLQQLAQRYPVAIVSGRERTDVEDLVGLPGLIYAGSHGLDIAGPGVRWDSPEAGHLLPTLDQAFDRLLADTCAAPGILIERKRYAIAVHYRLAAQSDVQLAWEAVERACENLSGLRLAKGKKVWELRPDIDWDKGRAIEWLYAQLRRSEPASYRPVFIGDDVTDEDGFRAVAGIGGVGVLVANEPRPSAATCRVPSTAAVAQLLEVLKHRAIETASLMGFPG